MTTSQGTVGVNINANAIIQISQTGTAADLAEGQSLIVLGPQDTDGSIIATIIIILPQGQAEPAAPPASPGQ